MLEKIKKLLGGDSWPTTVWGGLAVLVATVAYSPEMIDFLPDKAEGYIVGACKLMAAAFGLKAFQLTAAQTLIDKKAETAERKEIKTLVSRRPTKKTK